MSKSRFLSLIRRLFRGQSVAKESGSRPRNLRLMQLEDRRVLNATFTFNAVSQALTLTDFDNVGGTATLDISYDSGNDDYVFTLRNGANNADAGLWSGIDGSGVTGNNSSTLTVDGTVLTNPLDWDVIDNTVAMDIDLNVVFSEVIFADDVVLPAAATGGLFTIDVDGSLTIDNDIDTNGSSLTFDADSIAINESLTTDGGDLDLDGVQFVNSAADGDITTTAAVDSATASGTVDIDVSGTGTVGLVGDVVTTGADNAAGNGSAGGAVTVDTTDGTISVSVINADGGNDGAAANTGGAAGAITINTGNANIITLNADVSAVGGSGGTAGADAAVQFQDDVVLAADITVDGGDVTFAGTVNADDATANDRILIVNANATTGTAQFGSTIGATESLADFDVTGSLIGLGGNVTVDDGAAATTTLTGNVRLDANVAIDLDGTNDHSLVVTGTVDADVAANNRTLSVTAGTGNVDFQGDVGLSQALRTFDVVSATNLSLEAVTTQGGSGSDTITLGSGTAISGTLTLRDDLRTDGAGAGTATGNIRINATNTVVLEADGGGTAGSILVRTNDGGGGADGSITFVGGLDVQSATAYEDGLELDSGANNIDLSGATLTTLDHIGATTDTGNSVTLAAVTVGDGVGNGGDAIDITTGALTLNGNLDATADTSTNGGNVLITATATVLAANILIDTDAAGTDGNVTINSAVDSDDATTNDRTLTVTAGSGTAQFGSTIGATESLADFDVTGSLIGLGGNVTVDDGAAATTTLTGNVRLDANVAIDLDGTNDHSLVVTGTVDADVAANNRTLSVTAGTGNVDFQGDVGLSQALRTFDVVSATNLSLEAVTTQGGSGSDTITLGSGTAISGDTDTS